jgi:hypothetical protein
MRRLFPLAILLGCFGSTSLPSRAGDQKDDPLVVVNPAGKEVKFSRWSLATGTRRLPWLADDKAKAGPEFLEFREEKSTTYKDGVLTLVPVASLKKLDYDNAKQTVTLTVALADGKDQVLTGTTKFVGINKLVLEGDADLGDLGAATVKFKGGDAKQGVQGIRFPRAKAVDAVTGETTTIVLDDKEKSKHTVAGLSPLYLVDGVYTLQPHLMFKKTVKIDFAKIASLRHLPSEDKKATSYDFEVVLNDGAKHNLTLLTKAEGEKKGKAGPALVGLVGRVPAGYQLFPAHTIAELRAGEKKSP